MVWAGVIAILLLAVAAICLATPLSIGVRAPDEGDLLAIRVRHAAITADVWLPADVAMSWLAGIAEPPPISGSIAGIPIPGNALRPIGDAAARSVRDFGNPKDDPAREDPAAPALPGGPPAAPTRVQVIRERLVAATPGAALDELPRIRRAVRLDVFSFDLDYGTGDPVTTGMLAGILWQLASLLPAPAAIRARASWLEPAFRLTGEARVLIFPWRMGVAALCLGFAVARSAWKAHRKRPPTNKEIDPWPSRTGTGTEAPAAVPPSNPS